MIDNKDLESFKRLKCENILDLALLTPKSYEDNRVSNRVDIGSISVVEVKLNSYQIKPKLLKLKASILNFNQSVDLIFFNYSKYHISLVNSKIYIKAKFQIDKFENIQAIQPKFIDREEVGKISIKYSNKLLQTLTKKYIKLESFRDFKTLNAKAIVRVHHPDDKFLREFLKFKEFPKLELKALKELEALNHMLKLKSKKRVYSALKRLNNKVDNFIDSLPFKLTNDQKNALKDIERDLASRFSARRIIVGDVGSGKTILILASALTAFPNRAILMAPTTVLANQLYREAQKFLPKEVKTTLISNSKEDLEKFNFIIGTHKLLYQDLPEAELIMIDEQHRFGVNQREFLNKSISKSGKSPHFLQFSATPIPRTKAMIDSNLLDFSFLKEMPFKKEIESRIITDRDFKNLLKHIESEISKGNQIAIIYPLVSESENLNYLSIDEAKEFWLKRFKRVFVTHGKDREKDRVLEEFAKSGDILISTTVIEVGLSLPKLSTIVISGAERLGFATLHQLRGRVARNGLKGYCFLYSKQESKRLKEFIKRDSGFEIAELDLKMRESGELFTGESQSGKSFKFLNLSEDEDLIERAKNFIDRSYSKC